MGPLHVAVGCKDAHVWRCLISVEKTQIAVDHIEVIERI